jgi:hypothetical protein
VTTDQIPPSARHLHQLEAGKFARQGEHCDTRGCREPIAIYAWYYRRTAGQVLGYERFLCTAHGEAFATRHRLAIEPAPAAEELNLPRLEPRPGAYLHGMTAGQLALHEAEGWHCDWPRCRAAARYLSSRRYVTPAGEFRHEARFLCDPHARTFAARHGIDMAAVLPPEDAR